MSFSICTTLKVDIKKNDENIIPIGLMSATTDPLKQNLDQLDASFMYSRILKEIILNIEFNNSHLQEFITYCENTIPRDTHGRFISDDMKTNYGIQRSPVWWYIKESFLYPMLNTALLQMDTAVIIKMAFYISDLHRQIEQLYNDQFNEHTNKQSFHVYRGLGLPIEYYNRIKHMEGGLISFNSFLSTSKDIDVALGFASSYLGNEHKIPVLFNITIDPSKQFTQEEEILFSMHSIFRIQTIQPLRYNTNLATITNIRRN